MQPGAQTYVATDFGPFVNGGKYLYSIELRTLGLIETQHILICLITDPHYITGNIAHDVNGDCLIDPGDSPLPGWAVVAQNGTNTYYGTSDANGDYMITVPGNDSIFDVFTDAPFPYWGPCQDTIPITATANGSSTADFPRATPRRLPLYDGGYQFQLHSPV